MNDNYDYVDCFEEKINNPSVDISKVMLAFFESSPKWVELLFKIRNKIVSHFGLKNEVLDIDKIILPFKIGDKVGFFKVFEVYDNEVVVGEDDAHLDFRVSILLNKYKDNLLSVKTMVNFNNTFGKLYFFLIRPFHIIIVRTIIRNMKRKLEIARKLQI